MEVGSSISFCVENLSRTKTYAAFFRFARNLDLELAHSHMTTINVHITLQNEVNVQIKSFLILYPLSNAGVR